MSIGRAAFSRAGKSRQSIEHPNGRERDMAQRKQRPRDSKATQSRILDAAKAEFAAHGLGGARVDEIANRAKANKRMIYHYFGSKEDLFQAVVEEAYLSIREAEQALALYHSVAALLYVNET